MESGASKRLEEKAAIETTIVGGRPPGCGRDIGRIPRGIEVLVKKASVDSAFRAALLDTRSKSAALIGLALVPAEAAILDTIPRAQLEAIVERTTVQPQLKPAFLGYAAAVMLVALGATGCGSGTDESPIKTKGVVPDVPPAVKPAPDNAVKPAPPTRGIQYDIPKPKPAPDNAVNPNTMSRGVRPDVPAPKPVPPAVEPEKDIPRAVAGVRAMPPPERNFPIDGIRPDVPKETP